MIFYGKAQRRIAVGAALDEIAGWIAEASTAPLPIERHGAWTSALVAAGGLAQGLADAEEGGEGAAAGGAEAAMALGQALAAVMGRSWDTGFADLPPHEPPAVREALLRLRALPADLATVVVRRAEGFAHYAVYPEAFWQAAHGLAAPRPTRVLGLRSIGTTLSAAVAAALDAPVPVTARPEGHPFARTLHPAPAAAAALRADPDAVWAIVDEGPGLSGSSFGAAADALGRAGVPPERIVLLPSHAGEPGAMASEAHRRLWSRARSATVSFDELALGDAVPARHLAGWAADITGPLLAPPEDMAGGAWRRHRYAEPAVWPAVDRQNERRKYLLRGQRGSFLLRFTGLGSFGREKVRRAQALAEAGFGIAPLAWRHGFLVEPWRDDLQPLDAATTDRPALLRRLAAYLAFRARAFPAGTDEGASPDALLAMARINIAETLGGAAASTLDRWTVDLPGFAARALPVAVDGRLGAGEWLQDGAGLLLKTDALDHCCAHDLVGCQDIAWDVAGATVEHALSPDEAEGLRAAVARGSGRPCEARLVEFLRIAYAAFTLGALVMARDRETGREAERLTVAIAARRAAAALALG